MHEETTALVPIEERQVDFYGDDITAVLVPVEGEEEIYVPIKPICEYLGLNWSGQFSRVKRDPVLSQVQGICKMQTPRGGSQDMICLPLKYLNGWLFGVTPGKVKEELRDKIIRYQRDCYDALWKAFQDDALRMVERTNKAAPSAGLLQIREMGLAIVRMAEEQIELERNITRAHSRLDQAALAFKALDQRVSGIEKKLTPATHITEEQATEVSQAVKGLAEYLTSQDKSKNHYQAVFQEIYRRFGVSSYKNIRADQFAAVLKFLEEWREKGK